MPKIGSKRSLLGPDRDDLRRSGLTDSTIAANGIYTETDRAKLAKLLNRNDAPAPAMVFPYVGLDGKNGFCRVKPLFPQVDEKGKPRKYLQPSGEGCKAYFSAASRKRLLESSTCPVFVVEGEKKELCLAQEGFAAVSIGGVDCGLKPSTDDLIDDLAAIPLQGRPVFIVFDHDPKPATRENVARAQRRLRSAFLKAGAFPVVGVELPPGDGDKMGVDDFIVANGAQAFRDLVLNSIIKIIPQSAPALTPPVLAKAAYRGLIGKFLSAVAPFTEATDPGVLAHLLPAIGTLIGPGPHLYAGSRQPARLNMGLVGHTNSGRKGTSFGPVDLLMERVDPVFWKDQKVSGLSSGEGLIVKVADRRTTDEDGNVIIEPVEKRVYVIEPEFSRVLANIRREGNILSPVVRESFDSGDLCTLTVNPRQAAGAHISMAFHITPEELAQRLDSIELMNGFGNRILWFVVHSDKVMASTKPIPVAKLDEFAPHLRKLRGLPQRPMQLDQDAAKAWETIYPELRQDKPGLAGAATARRAAMVLRMALIYALVDDPKAREVKAVHLRAALAVQDYCEASAAMLFASGSGDPLGDKILALLATGPMTRSEFNRHLSPRQKDEVDGVLERLEAASRIRQARVPHQGAGRPATRWELVR